MPRPVRTNGAFFAATLCLALALFAPCSAAEGAPRVSSARRAFWKLVRTLQQKKIEKASTYMLGARELSRFARWKFDAGEWNRRNEEFLHDLSGQMAAGLELLDAKVADTLVVEPGKKNGRRVVLSVIHAFFTTTGGRRIGPVPFFMVLTGDGWKLWLRR